MGYFGKKLLTYEISGDLERIVAISIEHMLVTLCTNCYTGLTFTNTYYIT